MFAGYGGASFALKKAGIDFECVGYSEIDKYAIKCYEQNHNYKVKEGELEYVVSPENYGDCTKINPNDLPDFDLLTGGFPCQSFSVAGKGLGELDTRGTLFNEIIRIVEVKKPKYMLLENVKGLVGKKHIDTFNKILSELDRIGYYVKWKVLNSKEHGIPQNRERVFIACFRKGDLQFEVKSSEFTFPEKEELKLFLKDILEPEVDEKYYLKPERVEKLLSQFKMPNTSYFIDANYHKGTNLKGYLEKKRRQLVSDKIIQINNPIHSSQRVYSKEGISPTISAGNNGGGKEPCKIIQINQPKHANDRVYSDEGISPTLNTMQGGNRQPFIATRRDGQTAKMMVANTLTPDAYLTDGARRVENGKTVLTSVADRRIRKLTPTECFRLMGFLDDDINLDGLSNTQRYKLAGNGWDVNLVSKVFMEMFKF